jgi:hypothetical protein
VDGARATALRGVRRAAIGWVTALLAGLVVPFPSGCAPSTRSFDFDGLGQADRLEITSSGATGIRVVADESTVQAAASLLRRHQGGSFNSWGSGSAPHFIRFYQGTRELGTFGIGPSAVTNGPWTSHPPVEEMKAIFRQLGLPWQDE